MPDIPNTPAELFKLNDEPPETNPYKSDAVRAALDALHPDNGGTPADVQAIAEECIFLLRLAYEQALDIEDVDPDFACYAVEMINNLLGAEALVERSHFIDGSSAYRDET